MDLREYEIFDMDLRNAINSAKAYYSILRNVNERVQSRLQLPSSCAEISEYKADPNVEATLELLHQAYTAVFNAINCLRDFRAAVGRHQGFLVWPEKSRFFIFDTNGEIREIDETSYREIYPEDNDETDDSSYNEEDY